MFERWRKYYHGMSLTGKIRITYFFILIPMMFLIIASFINMQRTNEGYGRMIDAAGAASEFSLDFKADFDYETYLLIVENKSLDDSELDSLMNEAGRVVSTLENAETSEKNEKRLDSVKKYLRNLKTYKDRLEENIRIGNRYEQNIEIWENDVQIVTSLIRESMLQYIYYEISDMQESREAYNSSYKTTITVMVALFVLLTLASLLLSYFIPRSITKPIKNICEVTNKVAGGDFGVRAANDTGAEVGVLSESLNIMIDKINDLLTQVTTEQIRLRKAEFELLQAQINPHFLYNTLDTIIWLAEAGENIKVVEMVRSLSDFFRTSLNHGKEEVTLREELQHVGSYLKIQQVRYMDILEYEINVPDELMECRIPKITLQPLVENALYHGIKNKRGKGKIVINGEKRGDGAFLIITDNGIGMTDDRLLKVKDSLSQKKPETGGIYGLYNVNERIALRYGGGFGLSIESIYNEGTEVIVKIPYTSPDNKV